MPDEDAVRGFPGMRVEFHAESNASVQDCTLVQVLLSLSDYKFELNIETTNCPNLSHLSRSVVDKLENCHKYLEVKKYIRIRKEAQPTLNSQITGE
ncbi:MAG TPA: hypothetical protein VKA68_07650 [bacterium]|nr:hypothetical protein [bacterium]